MSKFKGKTRTRVIEATDETVTVAVNPSDWNTLDGEMLLMLTVETAEDLMHALEWWKDER